MFCQMVGLRILIVGNYDIPDKLVCKEVEYINFNNSIKF